MKLQYGDILVYEDWHWMYVGDGKNGDIKLVVDNSNIRHKGDQVGDIDTHSYPTIESLINHIRPGKFVISKENRIQRLLNKIDGE